MIPDSAAEISGQLEPSIGQNDKDHLVEVSLSNVGQGGSSSPRLTDNPDRNNSRVHTHAINLAKNPAVEVNVTAPDGSTDHPFHQQAPDLPEISLNEAQVSSISH